MKKKFILDRSGEFIKMEWSYKPEENPKALKKAEQRLNDLGIEGNVYEVAPVCFWYSTKDIKMNVETYE